MKHHREHYCLHKGAFVDSASDKKIAAVENFT